jgi:hypothetical protein
LSSDCHSASELHYQEQNDPEKFEPDPADENILPVNVEKNDNEDDNQS